MDVEFCQKFFCFYWDDHKIFIPQFVNVMYDIDWFVTIFPVVMYGCESWTVKKAEHQRIDAFELWCWRRLLRVPWTARRFNQSILKEISPEISLEGMMLKLNSSTLATSCEELTHWERFWCWKGLGARGKGDDRGWDGWMASPTRWMWIWVNSGSWW